MKKVIIGTVLLLTTTLSVFSQTKNITVSVSYRLVSNKGSTLLSQIQMFSPLFVHLQNIH